MNIINIFANGGKSKQQKGKELIKGIQNLLGITDDQEMLNLWQSGIEKYGSEEGLYEAIGQATSNLNENSSQEELQAAIASVFSQESQMFKCGGKLQQLVSRFAKGGPVDCGCGGIKFDRGGNFNRLPNRIYNENGILIGTDDNPKVLEYIDSRNNGRIFTVQEPTPLARVNNMVNQSRMMWNPESLPESYGEPYTIENIPYDPAVPESGIILRSKAAPSIRRPNLVELRSFQPGGDTETLPSVKAAQDYLQQLRESNAEEETPTFTVDLDPSTFNISRRAAKQMSGLSGREFRRALRKERRVGRDSLGWNWRNAGRNARAGVAGLTKLDTIDPDSIEIPEINVDEPALDLTPQEISVKALTPQEPVYNNFRDAFRAARQRGDKIFKWRDKDYTTDLAPEKPASEEQQLPYWDPKRYLGTPKDWSAGYRKVLEDTGINGYVRPYNDYTGYDDGELQNKPKRRNNWFVNATLNAQANEIPVSNAVMTASGFHRDKNGDWYQEVPTEADRQLGNNLAIIGAAGTAGMAGAAAAEAADAAAAAKIAKDYEMFGKAMRATNAAKRATAAGRTVTGASTPLIEQGVGNGVRLLPQGSNIPAVRTAFGPTGNFIMYKDGGIAKNL